MGQITHEETATEDSAGTGITSIVSKVVQGGTNMLYLVAVESRASRTVSGVVDSGTNFTWVELKEACGARNQIRGSVWVAYGTPSGTFTVTATVASGCTNLLIAVSRYSGTNGTTEDIVRSNTDGEEQTCDGSGTDGTAASVTGGTTKANGLHYSVLFQRNDTISSADADYTQRCNITAGSGGDQIRLYVYDRVTVATGDDTIAHTLSNTEDWAMVHVGAQPTARQRIISIM